MMAGRGKRSNLGFDAKGAALAGPEYSRYDDFLDPFPGEEPGDTILPPPCDQGASGRAGSKEKMEGRSMTRWVFPPFFRKGRRPVWLELRDWSGRGKW